MLVALLNVPKTEEDWNIWSLAHKLHHDEIRQAIQKQKTTNLTSYALDPINKDAEWLKRNGQTHQDMNEVMGLQGSDLEELDFDDEKQISAWIYSHYKEHQDIASALHI